VLTLPNSFTTSPEVGAASSSKRGIVSEPIAGDNIVVVCGKSHAKAIEHELPMLTSDNTVLEPSPKDSTAAIVLAAAILVRRNPDAIIGSFAADRVIDDQRRFIAAVNEAIATAAAGYIVTIGIRPDVAVYRVRLYRVG